MINPLIVNKIDNVLLCKNLIKCGHDLIEFTEIALGENEQEAIVNAFYIKLDHYCLDDYILDNWQSDKEPGYSIYSGIDALSKFLVLNIPRLDSPKEALYAIKEFGLYIVSNFIKPAGKRIKEDQIKNILHYLDNQFNFTNNVISKNKVIIALLDYSHLSLSSECIGVVKNNKDIETHFIIYHMSPHNRKATTPEEVFFHELGHALLIKLAKSIYAVPEPMVMIINELIIKDFATLETRKQHEIIADLFAIGMMYNSPFFQLCSISKDYNCNPSAYHKLVKHVIEILK